MWVLELDKSGFKSQPRLTLTVASDKSFKLSEFRWRLCKMRITAN